MDTRSIVALFAAATLAACVGTEADGGGDRCARPDPRGSVDFTVYESAAWSGVDVVPTFRNAPEPRDAIRCMAETVGVCTVTRCRNVGIDFVGGEQGCIGAQPGALSVTREGGEALSFAGGMRVTLARALAPAERLAVRTAGGDVPAFASSVTVPQRPQVMGPEGFVTGRGVMIGARDGFTMTWMPTSSRVVVTLRSEGSSSDTSECVFDGASGRGEIPSGAMTSTYGSIEVATVETTSLRAGVFPVTLRARWPSALRASYSRAE